MLAEDTNRLIKIDELYALRLDQYVSLPQLVVVGDQSSGKSSVLEGLTGLPFPRDSGLCTRFPTQIVFKRSKTESVRISIIQSLKDGKPPEPLNLFQTYDPKEFIEIEFSNVLKNASERMGIMRRDGSDHVGSSFSSDCLKIELSGPTYEHFSVIDLPGIFRKPTPGLTTKDDMLLVKCMINDYIKNQRSIILAVVPANVDIATQEIIQMADDVDSKGHRTLVVLTKPDLVDKGAESKVIDLLNESQMIDLGYMVVCNRSQSNLDISTEERNSQETLFFDTDPWKSIPRDRAGIKSLKNRLDKLLVDITRRNFRAVTLDVQQKIKECEKKLERLGVARQTTDAQRTFLTRIASLFQSTVTKAVDGYYARDSCFQKQEFRLATLVAELNETFSRTIFSKGSLYELNIEHPQFQKASKAIVSSITTPCSTESDEELDGGEANIKSSQNAFSDGYDVFNNLGALFTQQQSLKLPNQRKPSEFSAFIEREYVRSKGFEIGIVNPSLLPNLFLELSSPWEIHAQRHIRNAIETVHNFLFKLLQYVCDDSGIAQTLWTRLTPNLFQHYDSALAHTRFLTAVECSGKLITLNHYFADNLRKRRTERLNVKFRNLKSWETDDANKEPLLRLSDVLNTVMSNDDHTIEDIHDILVSYYKVALKRFIDAICIQAVDYHLVSSKESPLWLFSPEWVSQLGVKELEEIGGEKTEMAERRKLISDEMVALRAGKEILDK